MHPLIRYGLPALVVIVAIAVPLVVGWAAGNADDQRNYENAIAACERGNPLRATLLTNTRNAVEQAVVNGDPPEIVRIFRENLHRLLSVEGVDPQTGEVDCEAVIESP